jgi:Cof subfamily protein (haloacid dehalogenase superfamily)
MEPIQRVVVDLDGTLLTPDHVISPENAEAIARCREAGVDVMVASGRMFHSVRPFCMQLGLTGPQITLNGGAVVDVPDGEAEATSCLPEEVVLEIADALQARGLAFVIFGARSIYALPNTPETAVLETYGEPPAVIVPSLHREHVPDPVKFVVFANDPSRDAELEPLARGAAEAVRTGVEFFEFMTPGVSKGAALAKVLELHDIPARSVLAIGDYFNDLSMFRVAGISVAMGNAPEEVRAAADFVTGTCLENGLADALEQHVLAPARRALVGVTA